MRVWNIPAAEELDPYGSYDNKVFSAGEWLAHKDCIWQLVHHPYEQQLLSASADTTVKLWSIKENPKEKEKFTFKALQTFNWKINGSNREADTPTSVSFVNTDLSCIVAGYVHSRSLEIFDKETARPVSHLTFKSEDAGLSTQTNRVASHSSLPMIVSCHEDHRIRVFDLNTGIIVSLSSLYCI